MLILPSLSNATVAVQGPMQTNITGDWETNLSGTNLDSLVGHIVYQSYNPGYVILSYIISFIGAWTSMELLHMRTFWRGCCNWGILAGSSISLGGISCWCMHFISTRAIILGVGQPELQIVFSTGYTTASFWIPVIVVVIAFWPIGSGNIVSIPRVCLGGLLAGLGFSCMFYLGQAGISNYNCIYIVGYIIPSAIIACLASVLALWGFFYYRLHWNTTWWKRVVSALVLSLGTTGMHWLNIIGTRYQLKSVDGLPRSNDSGETTVSVVIILSSCASLVLLSISLVGQARRFRQIDHAQQVVLTTAIFDAENKILVSPSGLLPSKRITHQFLERSFDDVFTASHPVFLWIYRTTHNWAAIKYLIPAMRKHIDDAGLGHRHLRSRSHANLMTEDGNPVDDYSIMFRELFCLAATELAIHLDREIEDMGILYEEVAATGHISQMGKKEVARQLMTKGRQPIDPEAGTISTTEVAIEKVGKGQLLFLVSRANKDEAINLQAAGFRFADKEKILPMLSVSLQLAQSEISRRIDRMVEYIGDSHILSSGVHIACFAIRASISAGFDVLARKDAKNLLPTMQVPGLDVLEEWQLQYLKSMDLLTVAATMKLFNKVSKNNNPNEEQRKFAKIMLTVLETIKDEIDDPFFNDAQLIATPLEAPCKGHNNSTGIAYLITYKSIVPIHTRAPGNKLQFVPLNLFRTQQRVYPNSPDHATFARETFREFSKVLDVTGLDEDSHSSRVVSNKSKFSFRILGFRENGQEVETIDKDGTAFPKTSGGLLKPPKMMLWSHGHKRRGKNSSQEVLMASEDNASKGPPAGNGGNGVEMKNLANKTATKKAEGEKRTYIDDMFAITIKTKGGAKVR